MKPDLKVDDIKGLRNACDWCWEYINGMVTDWHAGLAHIHLKFTGIKWIVWQEVWAPLVMQVGVDSTT